MAKKKTWLQMPIVHSKFHDAKLESILINKSIDLLTGDKGEAPSFLFLSGAFFDVKSFAYSGLRAWKGAVKPSDSNGGRRPVLEATFASISVYLSSLLALQSDFFFAYDEIKDILLGVDNVQSFGKKPESMINCITFSKILAKDVEKTIKFFFEKKGMRTCLTQICMTGLAKEHPEWIPNKDEIKHACKIRDQINYPDSKLSISTMDASKYYCGAMICITIDGDVTPCSVIRKGYGNIYEQPLEEIIENARRYNIPIFLKNNLKWPEKIQEFPVTRESLP